jgi:hypothetical protein
MSWKPTEDRDEQVRGWMKGNGWDVSTTNYDFSREVYAWRQERAGGKSPTLRITQSVLEDYPAFALPEILDRLNVAAAIRAEPAAKLVVAQRDGRTVLEEW